MDYVRRLLPDVTEQTVVYDGESYPPGIINIREL